MAAQGEILGGPWRLPINLAALRAGGLPIDRCFPMEQAAEAHRYVEAGRKRGNVVIAMR